jgi:hypothetical protein
MNNYHCLLKDILSAIGVYFDTSEWGEGYNTAPWELRH